MSEPSPLAVAWDQVARAYDVYWGPRFAPWAVLVRETLAVHAVALPPGTVLVPTCGPGRELVPLAAALPQHRVVGLDLSAAMVALARVRCAGSPQLGAVVGDAMAVAGRFPGLAGIATCFGFQQLPDPAAALADWCAALAPGGVAVICYWTSDLRDSGPYAVAGAVLRANGHQAPARPWQDRLEAVIEECGAVLLADERPAFPIAHDGPEQFWDAMVGAGPWRSLANRAGDEAMEAMRAQFLAEHPPGPIRHEPAARLLVIRR